jgi:uncharacterized membrane protein YfcA
MPNSLDVFHLAMLAAAVCAGAVASITGFGIGSLLTPLLGLRLGTKLAVAVVSIPHFAGTLLRFITMREHVDRRVLISFGIMSAAGGLTGALLHTFADNPILTAVFGMLLIFTGATGLLGFERRMKFHGWTAWAAGGVSGLLGGLVGNQGGIRSAALLEFDMPKQAFVATATAIGLVVDAARMPVYLLAQGREIAAQWPYLITATAGVLIGTVAGNRLLRRIPEALFRRIVWAILVILGAFMIVKAISS